MVSGPMKVDRSFEDGRNHGRPLSEPEVESELGMKSL
jgi:hypothetical protein